MSTDTDVDPVEPWEDLQDSELDELMRIIRVVGRMKDSDPTFHACMTGSITAHVQGINRDLGKLIDRYAEGPRPRATSSVPRARTESRSDHALCETVNIRWVPLPLSDLAQVALKDLTLTGNAREWSTPYLQALTTHEEGQTHYGADTVESLIAYALSGMGHWQGESAEAVKAMFESYLPACQRQP